MNSSIDSLIADRITELNSDERHEFAKKFCPWPESKLQLHDENVTFEIVKHHALNDADKHQYVLHFKLHDADHIVDGNVAAGQGVPFDLIRYGLMKHFGIDADETVMHAL